MTLFQVHLGQLVVSQKSSRPECYFTGKMLCMMSNQQQQHSEGNIHTYIYLNQATWPIQKTIQ